MDRPRPTSTTRAALLVALACLGAGPATRESPPPPPPDRPTTAVEAESAYGAAVRQLRLAEGAVVRARQQAVADYRSAPEYVDAAQKLSAAHDAYAERLNGLLVAAEQNDPRYATCKKGAADVDADLAREGQNPAATPEAYADLLDKRSVLLHQLQGLEDDVVARAPDAKQLRQQWTDASTRLTDLQAKQPEKVEAAPAVRAAVAALADARSAVARARAALPAASAVDPDGADPPADDLLRRYSRHALTGVDGLPSGHGE
jgi:hypothetical protein